VSLLPSAAHPTAGIVELHVTAPRTTRTIGLVWMRSRPLSPPVRALLGFVRDHGLLPG
jgi:DNA-binding transcriptional LysR family regulator